MQWPASVSTRRILLLQSYELLPATLGSVQHRLSWVVKWTLHLLVSDTFPKTRAPFFETHVAPGIAYA